ncbi:MAG TPA: trypsin-like peptidase domain-containing protein, partial [Pedobacter sp.]
MKKFLNLSIILVLFLCSGNLYSQQFDRKKLEETISKAIEKAYPATVRIWGFDVVRQMQTSGQFSGVVVSADGHILTAAHVSTPNNTYKVMFPDGTSCIAKGLGKIEFADNKTMPDVAMMKIRGDGKWPYAEMGRSSALKKDEPCISIAYPESLNQALPTVRFGYIAELKNQYGFIRSTCIMEPGDSGGPLFDGLGRVIGLHSAVDVSENDNFEVPVDLYRKYWTALNIAETYKALPATEDAVENDPFAKNITAIPGLEKPGLNFKNIVSGYKGDVFLIRSTLKGKEEKIQGTLFSLEGLSVKDNLKNGSIFISKNSLVGDQPVIELDGNQIRATVIARDKENDLVLLGTVAKIRGGITLPELKPDTLSFNQLGKFLVSPQSDDTYKTGIIGSREFSLPKITAAAYMGTEIGFKQGWVVVTGVRPNSPAAGNQIEPGDQILSVNGITIDNPEDYKKALQQYWPDDKIIIKVLRADTARSRDITLLKEVVLGIPPQVHYNHPAELFEGGKSIRRDGFNKVFSHDTKLHPDQCGGPVLDLDGRFYGINTARFSRTGSIAIPVAVIQNFIRQ